MGRARAAFFVLLLAARLIGQDTALAAADALAAKADAEVTAALHARADALQAMKQYGRALQLRKEIVQEWAPGDATALKALGFVQVGTQWRRDADIVVFDRDLKIDVKSLKKADQDWARAQKDLVKVIERAAQALTAAGATDRATVYWRRLLRQKPGDARAAAAIQLPSFDGHAGTAEELRILRRGRAMVQAVQFLDQFDVTTVRLDDKHPLLAKAGLPHGGVQSDHFRVFGVLPEDKLQLAARCAERALLASRAMFGAEGGAVFRPEPVRNIVLCADKPTYQRVLDACADQFDKERLRFLKEDVELAFVEVGGDVQRLYALTSGGDDILMDVTSRGAVQDAVGFHTDGLWEGLGHATCGFLFDRTLSFMVEQQHGNTVTSWKPKPLLPDMASWREMATESAWAKNDTPTSRLVLLDGYKFTNDERVKAWAMVDYLVRTRPDLLLQLDAVKTKDIKDPLAVEAAFLRATGVDLRIVDDQWRDYWGKGEALRAAMAAAPMGSAADVDASRKLAWAIDTARAAADVLPAGFVVADHRDAKAAHEWVQQCARWETERKDPKKQDLPAPTPPLCIGTTVLLHRGTDSAAAVAGWMVQPVVRDWLLHPGRNILGCSQGKQSMVLDLTTPATPVLRGLPGVWPRHGQRAVPGRVVAADLGPGCAELLTAAGITQDAEVGMPVTLHFHRDLGADEQREVACRLRVGGHEREGVLLALQEIEGLAAPGCFAFVPREPLPAGEVEVQWTVPHALLQRDEVFPRATFIAR